MEPNVDLHLLDENSNELFEAAELYVETFKTEVITSHMFDFEKNKTEGQFTQAVFFMLQTYINKGHDIFIAKKDGRVVGIAVVQNPKSLVKRIPLKTLFPDMFKLVPLLTKVNYTNVYHFSKMNDLSSSLGDDVVTLSAIAVSPNHQGEGIGKYFFNVLHRFYAKYDKDIYLYTGEKNTKNYYANLGYELIEEIKGKPFNIYHMIYKV